MKNDDEKYMRMQIISNLIEAEKFKKALPIARKFLNDYRDEPIAYTSLALCLMETRELNKAINLLQDANHKFPHNHDILYNMAEALLRHGNFEKAEQKFHLALAETTADMKAERSECYTGLGVALRQQRKRDEALEMWKRAIDENPNNTIAKQFLHDFTNEYNEPAAPTHTFNDVYHFQKLQTRRYFEKTGQKEFQTIQEAEKVTSVIMEAWNRSITPHYKQLDAMTAAEKTELFNSVVIDFDADPKPVELKPEHTRGYKSKPDKTYKGIPKQERKILEGFDRQFPFLPPGSGLFMLFTPPALIALGLPEDRLAAIYKDATPTEEELEYIFWAIDVVTAVVDAEQHTGTTEEIRCILDANDIAGEYLENEKAIWVVSESRKLVRDGLRLHKK